MTEIQFEESDDFSQSVTSGRPLDFMDRLISFGAAKDRRQAEYILISIVIVALAITVYFFLSAGGGTTHKAIDFSKVDHFPASGT